MVVAIDTGQILGKNGLLYQSAAGLFRDASLGFGKVTHKIASIDAEDGERYEESIKKMTEGFPGLYEMYFAGDSIDEKVRKEAINDYVLSNGLGIDYYKDYGWDPVALN